MAQLNPRNRRTPSRPTLGVASEKPLPPSLPDVRGRPPHTPSKAYTIFRIDNKEVTVQNRYCGRGPVEVTKIQDPQFDLPCVVGPEKHWAPHISVLQTNRVTVTITHTIAITITFSYTPTVNSYIWRGWTNSDFVVCSGIL